MRLLLAITCCLVCLPAAPADLWVRIRSANFELFTTAGERNGRDLVLYLEQVRTFFVQAFDLSGSGSPPLRIVSFRTDKEYQPYSPSKVADAFFQPGIDHDYIVMKSAPGELYPTAVHEYTHLLLRQTQLDVPQWLSEGLAELYSNLETDGSQVRVGKPIPSRVQALARERWIDLRAVIGPGPLSADKKRAAMFYAESWALVHMLSLDSRYSPRLRQLFDALQKGDPARAFDKVYGKPIERVQADLRAYVLSDSFRIAVFDLRRPAHMDAALGEPTAGMNAALPARLALAELLSNDQRNLAKAGAAYRALSREYENRWEVEAGWGGFCARERRNDEAIQHFARAAGLGSDDARMYLAYARVLKTTTHARDAIGVLQISLRLDPALDVAHFELAVALARSGSYREALAEFHRIKTLGPEYAYRYFYYLAVAHSRVGDSAQARRLIDKARLETRNPEEITALDRLLRSVDGSPK